MRCIAWNRELEQETKQMLILLLIGLALSYHWPEPVADQDRADADTEQRMPRPLGPLICTGAQRFGML